MMDLHKAIAFLIAFLRFLVHCLVHRGPLVCGHQSDYPEPNMAVLAFPSVFLERDRMGYCRDAPACIFCNTFSTLSDPSA